MVADAQGFDPDKNYVQIDNEFWDGTDGAHQAWWRGEKFGCQQTIRVVTEWLDKPLEDIRGCSQADVQVLKERIMELRAKHGF